ncbi:MAG: DUF1592 domain-containing protein [Opitutales bacterium]
MTLFAPGFRALVGLSLLTPLFPAEASKSVLKSYKSEIEPILDSYCYDCHGFGTSKGGVTLDEFTADSIGDHELWLRILRNTRSHIMPPVEEEFLPTSEERERIADWIKTSPFGIDLKNPDPGKITIQRLNRVEYQNTIRELIGIEFDTADAFPADDSGEGFDNIGDILTLSPMMLEKYLDAAGHIVSEAVPTQASVLPEHKISGEELVHLFSPATIKDDEDNDKLQLSFYSPSTRSANYQIKHPGKYQIVLSFKPVSFSSFRGFDYNRCRFIFKIDGKIKLAQEFEYTSGRTIEHTFDYDWQPGDHSFTVEVEPLTTDLEKIKRLKMRVESLNIKGPYARDHWIQPKKYERFFPGGVPENETAKADYTRKLLGDFATRAFRRPVDRQTVDQLVALAKAIGTQENKTYEMGISQAMAAILASPRFLFREEKALSQTSQSQYPLIDEYSLASRISYFLWSSMPDEELFQLAHTGQLRDNLDAQIERMMANKRSKNFINNFAGQWLHARDIQSVNISSLDVWLRDHPQPEMMAAKEAYSIVREIPKNKRTPEQQVTYTRTRAIMRKLYDNDRPELKSPLQRAMREETELYFDHVIREDRSLKELLDSNYTFLNDRLATHYNIDGIKGSKMRKVTLAPGSPRGGVLTQGTILAYTSNPTRTSPVKRGVFILENILGTPPAAPPPNIPALEDVASPDEIQKMSLRESLALHRKDPLCRSCHNRMDPLGLAFENFNAMGNWRDAELNHPIETDGRLITGETFNSIQEMKRILANERINDFYYCFSEKLLTYALGRGIEYYDTATLDTLVETLKNADGRPSSLIRAIVHSTPFQKRRNSKFKPENQ